MLLTSFDPAVDYYLENKNKFSTLIYFTDGECSPPSSNVGRMLWVLSSRSTENKQLPSYQIKLN